MIAIKPSLEFTSWCPECSAPARVNGTEIAGMLAYADCTCLACGTTFFDMLPSGHFVSAAVKVKKAGNHVYNDNEDYHWLSAVVSDSFPLQERDVTIRKKVFTVSRNVVILNTLDFLYGHSLLKLFNAQHHLEHDCNTGLIVIVPAILEWMVPAGCVEVWIVDLSLNDLRRGYEAIRHFVASEMMRFDRIFISRAYSHPEVYKLDISRFTGVAPFDLREFGRWQPCITFVLREDRWWLRTRFDYLFYRVCRKTGFLKQGRKVLSLRQNALVRRTIRLIRQVYPHASFCLVGLGSTGTFHGIANDLRVVKASDESEKRWCHAYARSHVVIGFHGSNMLLPTALAAGCVEILPEDRYGNIVQDISARYRGREQLFFYRFTDQYSRPGSVAAKATAIIRDYKMYHRNMCENVYTESVVDAIPDFKND